MRLFVSALEYSANIHLKYLLSEMIKSENIELCGIFDESIIGNLSLELHSADFGIFGASQTISLVSRPKFAENYESQTENPSVVDSTQSVESNEKIKSKKPPNTFFISGKSLCDISEVAVMGFIDVLKRARFFLELRKKCLNIALSADKILLMDSSSFNIPLAKRVKKCDSRKEIMYYILPQVWAWKPWRAKVIEANCDKLAAILPFEVGCYEKKARFVGHPLLDEIQQFRGGNVENSSLQETSLRSFWATPFALVENFGEQQTPSLVLSPKFSTNTKFPPQILELDSNKSNSNATESSLRGRIADSREAIQNNNESAQSATESRPIRGAKNRNQTSSSASADFLLESDKRGSPPKSEKRQLLARRGSGVGGAALLRKEKGDKELADSKADLSAESRKEIDSRFALDSRDLDSSLTAFAQNDDRVDCHESLRDSRNDGMGADCFGNSSELPRNDESVDCHDLPKANLAMTSNSDIFTFMPGSRLSEINRIFPIFLQVKDMLKKRDSTAQFHLVVPKKFKLKNLNEIYGDLNDFHITFDAHTSLLQSTFAFICSGTATLECALIGTPFVLGYQGRWIEAFVVKQFLNIRFVGLANLLYSHIAPDSQFHIELLQENLTAKNLLDSYHNANPNDFLRKSLALRAYLKSGSARAVAQWLLEK